MSVSWLSTISSDITLPQRTPGRLLNQQGRTSGDSKYAAQEYRKTGTLQRDIKPAEQALKSAVLKQRTWMRRVVLEIGFNIHCKSFLLAPQSPGAPEILWPGAWPGTNHGLGLFGATAEGNAWSIRTHDRSITLGDT